MRMHTHGKCTPNIAIGALLIFSFIVLYNNWKVSTINHDLTLRVHSLEQQIISISKSSDALRSNLEKVEGEKEKVEVLLHKEEEAEQQEKALVSEKESSINSLRMDLESSRQETKRCQQELSSQQEKLKKQEKETTHLKSRIVNFEAQLVEKTSTIDKLTKELAMATDAARKKGKSDVVKNDENPEPVLINDPAEREMNPNANVKPPSPIQKPGQSDVPKPEDEDHGGEQVGETGVLSPPRNEKQFQHLGANNLDALEDDNDGHLQGENGAQDDQAPDGTLPRKNNGALAPPPVKGQDNNEDNPSIQDGREAAHLPRNDLENQDFNDA